MNKRTALDTSREIRQWLKIIVPLVGTTLYFTNRKFRETVNNVASKIMPKQTIYPGY